VQNEMKMAFGNHLIAIEVHFLALALGGFLGLFDCGNKFSPNLFSFVLHLKLVFYKL
jgi:hypothetical protein